MYQRMCVSVSIRVIDGGRDRRRISEEGDEREGKEEEEEVEVKGR